MVLASAAWRSSFVSEKTRFTEINTLHIENVDIPNSRALNPIDLPSKLRLEELPEDGKGLPSVLAGEGDTLRSVRLSALLCLFSRLADLERDL